VWRSFAFEVGEKKSLGKVEEIWKKSLEKVGSYSISVFKRHEISLEKKELSSQTILYSC
jgi:hypothetical protein